ncbi:ATP-binding protein [Ligilactobacillus equi]|uniref:ATP-binding protein n=1 Tax=Ligilactobacillus equi TaxID=137357 RepID=UPI002ED2765D
MYPRPQYLEKLKKLRDSDLIKVITGVRRSGKSVLLKLYQQYLLADGVAPEQVIYLNFEDFENQLIRTEHDLHQVLARIMPRERRFYLLLDEVQLVDGWQRVVNGVRSSFDCELVITGSNARMLSGELATLLSGRYVEIPIYPLSFQEFVATKEPTNEFGKLATYFEEYEKFGGFPTVVDVNQDVKDDVLNGIHNTIILNDVAERSSIRDVNVLKSVVAYLADNVGQLVNPRKISGMLTSSGLKVSAPTVNSYLQALCDAFLFYQVRQYDLRGKNYLKSNGKYFIVDSGLRRNAIGAKLGNFSNRLENIVYLELLRRGYMVDVGKLGSQEIDFVARKNDELLYVQVTYEIPENTHETDNLLLIKDNYQKLLITQKKYYDITQIDGIMVVNVVDWLLGK